MITPEPQLTALLEVIYRASIRARDLGYGGKTLPEERRGPALLEVSDLMDVITHNIPLYLTCYDHWDEQLFLGACVAYDQKWGATPGLRLSAVYEDALNGTRSSVESIRVHFGDHKEPGGA